MLPLHDFTRPDAHDCQAFKAIFSRSLHDFWHPVFKFDVIMFDNYIGTPDGVSCADHVLAVYGADALALATRLVKL